MTCNKFVAIDMSHFFISFYLSLSLLLLFLLKKKNLQLKTTLIEKKASSFLLRKFVDAIFNFFSGDIS